jgi:hypothetical protein
MGTHAGFGGAGDVTVMRQISAVIAPLTARRSVDVSGVVQCRWTTSPIRSAVRSFTTSGRFSDGGCGGPGLAQPAARRIRGAAAIAGNHLRGWGWQVIRENFIDF